MLRLLLKKTKSQSILEYALLVGIVAAALLLMQSFVKRGFQGNLKDSADRMGEQFSPSGTTTQSSRMLAPGATETIREETATTGAMDLFTDESRHIYSENRIYNYSAREGGENISDNKSRTDSAEKEAYNWDALPDSTEITNYPDDNNIFGRE